MVDGMSAGYMSSRKGGKLIEYQVEEPQVVPDCKDRRRASP